MKGLKGLLAEAQKFQQRLLEKQEELKSVVVTGTAGAGMVKVSINGRREVIEVKIDPKVYEMKDVEFLEDLTRAAFNSAIKELEEVIEEKMSELTGGIKIPGFKM